MKNFELVRVRLLTSVVIFNKRNVILNKIIYKLPHKLIYPMKKKMKLALKIDEQLITPKFEECIFDLFQCKNPIMYINITQKSNTLIVTPSNEKEGIPLSHAPHCPMQQMNEEHLILLKKQQELDYEKCGKARTHISVAVSVLLEDLDGRVLITKRNPTLRTFPNAWVMPGGHVDENETLEQAAVREIYEETNIQINENDLILFGAWESAFPAHIENGIPKRHHFIIYYTGKVNPKQIEKMKMQTEEVMACAWIDSTIVKKALSKMNHDEDYFVAINNRKEWIKYPIRDLQSHHLDVKQMIGKSRLTTATQFILSRWLN